MPFPAVFYAWAAGEKKRVAMLEWVCYYKDSAHFYP